MGVNYTQHCILGYGGDLEDYKVVIEDKQYEKQPRYDTKTGEISHYENVLVKNEESHYKLFGCENEYGYELLEDLSRKYKLNVGFDFYNAADFAIGYHLGDGKDCGRVDLIEGVVDVDWVVEKRKELADILNCSVEDIKIHFLSNVG